MQFHEDNDNYLKLNQHNLNDDELPLFDNIISNNYNKEYKAPIYEHDKIEKEEKKEEKEEENVSLRKNDEEYEKQKIEEILKEFEIKGKNKEGKEEAIKNI